MPIKNQIFALVLALCAFPAFAQNLQLKGKVVEIKEDKVVGVSGIKISVKGTYDITQPDGSFRLNLPRDLDYVVITLENCPHQMVAPMGGRVNLPPSDLVLVRVCSEQNQKLLEKVGGLEQKIKAFEKERRLSRRQLDRLYETMLDTIQHFQGTVQSMTDSLARLGVEQEKLKMLIGNLENENRKLEQQLFDALGEKFLAQQKVYEEIASGLNTYRSRLKDVQKILPDDVPACIESPPQPCENFYATLEKYFSARQFLLEKHDGHVSDVNFYWADAALASQLEETYKLIFKKIHEPLLFERMNDQVRQPILLRSQEKISRKEALKRVKKGTEEILTELKPLVEELDRQIDDLLEQLGKTIG
jgi:hypothetical protein